MSYTLKKNKFRYKDPDTGEYQGIDVVAERSFQEYRDELYAITDSEIARITEAGSAGISDMAPIFVPQQFCAKGDGVSDDTNALINTFSRSNAVIDGANQSYKITEITLVGRENLLIQNFRFYHGICITLKHCKNIIFRNCIWDEFQDNGIPNKNVQCVILTTIHTGSEEWVEENNWRMDEVCKNITFDNCQFLGTHFTENTPSLYEGTKPHYNTGMCLRLEGVDGLRVVGCYFTQNRGNACVQQNCYAPLGDFEFSNNLFYLNGYGGIELYRNTGLPGHPTRVIQGNRFIGHGLGYLPWDYLERFPENERGVGTAVLLGGSTARVKYGPCFCTVYNNIFEDNNESSVEGWQWNPIKNNLIIGNGVLQSAESVEEMREKYKITYPLYIRKNPSQNPIYMNQTVDQEFYPEGEIRSIENNTIGRGYGTKNPILIRGYYYEPIVFRNNTLTDVSLETERNSKFVHFLKCTFDKGLIWEGNVGMRPYFNECNFTDGEYGVDDLHSMYKCTFGSTAIFENLSKTDRFQSLKSGRLSPEFSELRDNEVSESVNGQPILGFEEKDTPIVVPTPVFDIKNETGYTEDTGYVFPGYETPTIVDTNLSIGETDTNWTIFVDTTTTGDNDAGDNSWLIRLLTISDSSENISLQFGSRYRNQPYTYIFCNGYYGDDGRIDGSSARNFLAVGSKTRFILRHKSGEGKIEVYAYRTEYAVPSTLAELNRGSYDFTSGTAGTLRFGGSMIGSSRPKSYYNGIMKEAEVFNVALSDAQVSILLVGRDISVHTDIVPVYDIENDQRYDEGVGLVMDGTFAIDTQIPILENTNDFTIVAKFKFDDMTADGERPNFSFVPVFSAMSADMASDVHTGHNDKGFDVGLSLQEGKDLSDTAAGGFIGFRRDWRYTNYVPIDSANYHAYFNYEYTVVIRRKDNVITLYDDNLLEIGTLTGEYATTLITGNLTIGAKMGYGQGYTDFFKGVIQAFRVYDEAIPIRYIEREFPSLEDNEASDKGAVTYHVVNKSSHYRLSRYAVIEISYDLGQFNDDQYAELYPKAFGIKLDAIYDKAIWVPCGAANRIQLIRVCKWDAVYGPYDAYKVTIVNPGTVPGMNLRIRGIKALLLSEDEAINSDSFEVIWKTDIDEISVGRTVAGYISYSPAEAKDRMTITVSSDNTDVATVTKYGTRIAVTGVAEGEANITVASTTGQVEIFNVVVTT